MQTPTPDPPLRLTIDARQQATRLDRAIADWRGLSRSAAHRLLDSGAVSRNGRRLKRADKGLLLQAGDKLELDPRFAGGEAVQPDATLQLEFLAQGPGWLAVNKPPGMPVRPHAIDETGTVLNAIAARRPEVHGVGEGGLRSGVVHRLDNETSGVLLVATEQSAWQRLRGRFAAHDTTKRYTTLVHGTPDETGSLTLRLRVAQHRPARVIVCDPYEAGIEARGCSLAWRVLERLGRHASLVEVDLHTGFLHQVRVSMAHLGCPVIGDAVYGEGHTHFDAPRQMLHASTLGFEDQTIEAPLPDDMQQVIRWCRRQA